MERKIASEIMAKAKAGSMDDPVSSDNYHSDRAFLAGMVHNLGRSSVALHHEITRVSQDIDAAMQEHNLAP